MIFGEYVELEIEGLSEGTSLRGIYIVVLREKGGKRLLPLLVSHEEYGQLYEAMRHPHRGVGGVFAECFRRLDVQANAIYLNQDAQGNQRALFSFTQQGHRVSVEGTPVALLLTAIELQVPIVYPRRLFEMQYRQPEGEGLLAVPIRNMSRELLEAALADAVAKENFELASALRDELKRRTQAQ